MNKVEIFKNSVGIISEFRWADFTGKERKELEETIGMLRDFVGSVDNFEIADVVADAPSTDIVKPSNQMYDPMCMAQVEGFAPFTYDELDSLEWAR